MDTGKTDLEDTWFNVTRLVIAVLLSLPTQAPDVLAQVKEPEHPEAAAILGKVRDTYRNLSSFHFERVLLLEETGADGKPARIAELTLITATEHAKAAPAGEPFALLNLDRFRMGLTTRQGEILQVCDGVNCWSYSSMKNEFMKGERFRDVSTSVGSSVLLGLHDVPFSILKEGRVLADARLVRVEEVEVGNERRKCDVIEGALPPAPSVAELKKSAEPPTLGIQWVVSMIALQGLAEQAQRTFYSPWPDENAMTAGAPTLVTLWIDQASHLLVRSRMSTHMYKRGVGNANTASQKVDITAATTFTVAATGPPPADLFRFTPPDGAREVPNAASRRQKKD